VVLYMAHLVQLLNWMADLSSLSVHIMCIQCILKRGARPIGQPQVTGPQVIQNIHVHRMTKNSTSGDATD